MRRRLPLIRVHSDLSDTVLPSIVSSTYGGNAGWCFCDDREVSVTFSVSETVQLPVVTLFNGARSATTRNTVSPYTFTYTLRSSDSGPISYRVTLRDLAGNTAVINLAGNGQTAGTICRLDDESQCVNQVVAQRLLNKLRDLLCR